MYRPIPTAARAALWTASLILASASTLADGIETTLSGYGTVGGTFTSNGKYTYVHDETDFTGASNSFDVGLESRLGVQAVITFSPQWSVTAQEEAKQRNDTTFDPGTQWLYVQYQPYSDLKLRVGRVVLPAFLYSDVIDVGYAVPWFRPPNEIYDASGFYYIDGMQAKWQHTIGPVQVGLEVSYGNDSSKFDIDGNTVTANAKNTFNGAITLTWGNLQARYAQTDLKTSVAYPVSATDTLNIQLNDYFHCYGLQYDDGKAIFISEYVKRNEPNVQPFNAPFGIESTWYVAPGWRFGKFTPMVTYASLDTEQSLVTGPRSVHTWGASLRYDVVPNLALKAQVNRAQAANGSYWLTPQTVQQYIEVYSFGADFVF